MKFFIVDDDPDTLALVARLLTDAGHEVTVRASSNGALRDIPEARPDCVITDLMMPGMDGFELTRELRRKPELAGMKIMILSAKSYDVDRRRAKGVGPGGYLPKAINRDPFMEAIGEILTSRVAVQY